jgi:hypothetical protein
VNALSELKDAVSSFVGWVRCTNKMLMLSAWRVVQGGTKQFYMTGCNSSDKIITYPTNYSVERIYAVTRKLFSDPVT